MREVCKLVIVAGLSVILLIGSAIAAPNNPIVFVTQVPEPQDFATIGSVFANHQGAIQSAPRGGDLYIRYPNGTLKNLTKLAGYGVNGFQGDTSIAVRDPAVHWSGNKVIFSMVIGGAGQQYEYEDYFWQLYEVTGLGVNQNPIITKVPNQPEGFNNVMPAYATDDQIIFSTDRPRNGAEHLYPQLDEYESTATNTGIWKLNPATGELILLDHAPSGAFNPIVDSAGRIIYTRWDHLQRDQQADAGGYGAFNYSSESASSVALGHHQEVFPEPRDADFQDNPLLNLHNFNHFFPWEINEDGTAHETVNHIGRHELHEYFDRSFNNDPNLSEFNSNPGNTILNFLQVREDPNNPGDFFGIDAPEFRTHSAGQIVRLNAATNLKPHQMTVDYITHRDTASYTDDPEPTHSGLYRNPLPLANGELVAVHSTDTREENNDGTRANPQTRYNFRIKLLQKPAAYFVPGSALTAGIVKNVSYYDPDVLVSYNGLLWELQPVEVKARAIPAARQSVLPAIEQSVFDNEDINLAEFKEYLRDNNLALIVSRNVTTRDIGDLQQPFNLRVPGGGAETISEGGKVYDISALQIFQGDQIRGYTEFSDGRRVIPQPLHAINAENPENPGGPAGSVKIAADGSVAALVPARRALTWQLTAPNGTGVVRERYWLSFQPGEIRVCTSCHGLNHEDQLGREEPENVPLALKELLDHWRDLPASPAPEIALSARMRDRAGVTNRLIAGSAGIFQILGSNSASASKTFQLGFKVAGQSCGNARSTFVTDDNGEVALSGTTPKSKVKVPVVATVFYQGTEVSSTRIKIKPKGKKKSSSRQLREAKRQKICQGLLGFH